jgi:hypothetical protein
VRFTSVWNLPTVGGGIDWKLVDTDIGSGTNWLPVGTDTDNQSKK